MMSRHCFSFSLVFIKFLILCQKSPVKPTKANRSSFSDQRWTCFFQQQQHEMTLFLQKKRFHSVWPPKVHHSRHYKNLLLQNNKSKKQNDLLAFPSFAYFFLDKLKKISFKFSAKSLYHSWISKQCYSRVHISSDSLFSKILKKPSKVQKKMIPHIKGLDFSQR